MAAAKVWLEDRKKMDRDEEIKNVPPITRLYNSIQTVVYSKVKSFYFIFIPFLETRHKSNVALHRVML